MADDDRRGAVSIRDVARLARVSVSTVSRVLNGPTGGVTISAATAKRVRRAAAELHYQPNAWARSLRTTRTRTIGVIVHDLRHPFTAELLRVVYVSCIARGYHMLVSTANHRGGEGQALGDILTADRVDGILLVGVTLPHPRPAAPIPPSLRRHGHVVAIGGRPAGAGALWVTVDYAAGVALALDYLVALGHRTIAYICDEHNPGSWVNDRRREAYRHGLRAHGLPWTPALEQVTPATLDGALAALRRWLAAPTRPTAVFASDDMMAILTLRAALSAGIRVPDDLSLIGFDDIPFAALCTPGLTTIHQPIAAMGRHAIDALLDRIERPVAASPDAADAAGPADAGVVFSPTLVSRESCGPP